VADPENTTPHPRRTHVVPDGTMTSGGSSPSFSSSWILSGTSATGDLSIPIGLFVVVLVVVVVVAVVVVVEAFLVGGIVVEINVSRKELEILFPSNELLGFSFGGSVSRCSV